MSQPGPKRTSPLEDERLRSLVFAESEAEEEADKRRFFAAHSPPQPAADDVESTETSLSTIQARQSLQMRHSVPEDSIDFVFGKYQTITDGVKVSFDVSSVGSTASVNVARDAAASSSDVAASASLEFASSAMAAAQPRKPIPPPDPEEEAVAVEPSVSAAPPAPLPLPPPARSSPEALAPVRGDRSSSSSSSSAVAAAVAAAGATDRRNADVASVPIAVAASSAKTQQPLDLLRKIHAMEQELEESRRAISRLSVDRSADMSRATLSGSSPFASFLDSIAPKLSRDEVSRIRRELADQELLINGFQKENERLVLENKALGAQTGRKEGLLLEENHRLRLELQELRIEVGRLQMHNDAEAPARIVELQSRLDGERRAAEAREMDLKFEIDRLRKAKKELEARTAGVDLERLNRESGVVRDLEQRLQTDRARWEAQTQEMRQKIRWYVENQDAIDKKDAEVAQLRRKVKDLEEVVAAASSAAPSHHVTAAKTPKTGGTAGKTSRSAPGSPEDKQRIQELEKKVAALQARLAEEKGGAPTSVAALIRAVRPSESENEEILELRKRLQEMTDDARIKDEEFEGRVRTLRLQFDKIKEQYEERIAKMETELKELRAHSKPSQRIKELEKQLEETRAHYHQKMKHHPQQQQQQQHHPQQSAPAAAEGIPSAGESRSEEKAIVMDAEAQTDALPLLPVPTPPPKVMVSRQHLVPIQPPPPVPAAAALYSPLDLSQALKVDELRNELRSLHNRLADSDQKSAAQLLDFQRHVRTVEHSAAERTKKVADAYEMRMMAVVEEHASTVAALQAALEAFQARQQSLDSASAGGTSSTSQKIMMLAGRLEGMEQQLRKRTQTVQAVVDEVRSLNMLEMEAQRQRYEFIIRMKDEEIARFKVQLDLLIARLKRIESGQAVLRLPQRSQSPPEQEQQRPMLVSSAPPPSAVPATTPAKSSSNNNNNPSLASPQRATPRRSAAPIRS